MHCTLISRAFRLPMLAVVACFVCSTALHAGIFLRLDKSSGGFVAGESVDQQHPAWIELESCNAGVRTAVSFTDGGGFSAGKPEALEFSATKWLDKASPLLFLSCAQSTLHPRAVIEFTDDNVQAIGPKVYLRLTLTNVAVSSLSTTAGEGRPKEALSLSYGKIQIEYFMMDSKGAYPSSPTSTATWNFVTNTAG
jgi:type VI secretion system secreted protein Hcp